MATRKKRTRRTDVNSKGTWMGSGDRDGLDGDVNGGGERYHLYLDDSPVSAQGTHWIDVVGKQRLETDTDPAEIIRLLGGGD